MIRVLYMGRKRVAARCLERLAADPRFEVAAVVTDHHLERSATAELARKLGLPLVDLDEAKRAVETKELRYDLGLSMLYWRRLKGCFLGHPQFGTINFHPAPLPEYKGVGGYNLAVLHRLDRWAVSAHFIDAGIDTGPIIKKNWFVIDPAAETAQSIERESQAQLELLFNEVMELVATAPGDVPTTPSASGVSLTRAELEAMKAVDVQSDDVDAKVRAFWFPPYDGAYIEIGGERYTLVNRAILESLADADASPVFRNPVKARAC